MPRLPCTNMVHDTKFGWFCRFLNFISTLIFIGEYVCLQCPLRHVGIDHPTCDPTYEANFYLLIFLLRLPCFIMRLVEDLGNIAWKLNFVETCLITHEHK